MEEASKHDHRPHPLMRIFTFGEFALERLVSCPTNSSAPPRYIRLAPEEWSSRGSAQVLLKVLLCRANRRASKGELMETIWHAGESANAIHALDSAASFLRRHILCTHSGESLLCKIRGSEETSFKLSGQSSLWVDADALLSLAAKATRAESQGQDPLPLLEAAHTLTQGEFLEDNLCSKWAQGRRHLVNGVRHRVLYKLVELHLKEQRISQAEELLFAFLAERPTDEDVLCHLMVLLGERGRRQEALEIYHYTAGLLQEVQREPALHTKELARRIRHGLAVREQRADYPIIGPLTPPMAVPLEQAKKSSGRLLRFAVKRA